MTMGVLEASATHFGALAWRLGAGVAVFIGFLCAALLVRRALQRLMVRVGNERADLLQLAGTTAFFSLLVIGVISGLGTMGVDVAALVAGLGLTGFALGFALRDAVANLLAGILVLSYRPFRRGDHIAVAGFDGTVVGIDLRYTTLQSADRRVLIPNQTLFTNPITLHLAGPPAGSRRDPAS